MFDLVLVYFLGKDNEETAKNDKKQRISKSVPKQKERGKDFTVTPNMPILYM